MMCSTRVLVVALGSALLAAGIGCSNGKGKGGGPNTNTTPDAAGSTAVCSVTAPCALASGTPVQGTIATLGQSNIYLITVPADQAGKRPIIQILLDRTAAISAVQPVFSLASADSQTTFGAYGPGPQDQPVHLSANFLVLNPGNYLLAVHDVTDMGTDPNNPYTVTANIFDDPDMGEPDDTVPMARPVTFGTQLDGWIAFMGDHDLCAFTMAQSGPVQFVMNEGQTSGLLQLQMQIIQLNATTPDNLLTGTVVANYGALQPGDALSVNVVRLLNPGNYVVWLQDQNEVNADATPAGEWTLTVSQAMDADPGKQMLPDGGTLDNQTAAGAIVIPSTGTTMVSGVIAYQGDHDWFHIHMPTTTLAQIIQVGIDPMDANTDMQLAWAVGTQLTPPSGACNESCGPTDFCVSGSCGYNVHGLIYYNQGDTTPQVVRLRQYGPAEDIYILVEDQGDLGMTTNPYTITVSIMGDPDPNEPAAPNDTWDAATPVTYTLSSPYAIAPATVDGGPPPDSGTPYSQISYSGSGMISWYDYITGDTTAQEPEDLDWFELPLPPLEPAPCVVYIPPDAGPDAGEPDGGDAGEPDGGDAGESDAGDAGPEGPDSGAYRITDAGISEFLYDAGCETLTDGGDECAQVICSFYPDGGPVLAPRPDYGIVASWHGPADGTYELGLQATASVGNSQGCLFSFDQTYAHPYNPDGGWADGGYIFGNKAADPCLCLPASQAAGKDIWVRIEGPHRPIPNAANAYSDEPYGWELDLTPLQLQPTCNRQCSGIQANACP